MCASVEKGTSIWIPHTPCWRFQNQGECKFQVDKWHFWMKYLKSLYPKGPKSSFHTSKKIAIFITTLLHFINSHNFHCGQWKMPHEEARNPHWFLLFFFFIEVSMYFYFEQFVDFGPFGKHWFLLFFFFFLIFFFFFFFYRGFYVLLFWTICGFWPFWK